MSENKLITCPYDEAHKVKASRLQLHIAKCKLNHLDLEKKPCPFNATHLLERGEFDYHLQNCPDRGALDRHMAQTLDKNNPYKGRTATPHFSDPHIEEGESWDTDLSRTIVRPAQTPPGAVIEPPPMSKPAERKKLYQNLHQMSSSPTQPENKPVPVPIPSPSPAADKAVCRQPKEISGLFYGQTQSEKPNGQLTGAKSIENLGLGRGKPSRIAANIFDNTNANNGPSEGAMYSNVVRDMSNLGLARGRPANQVPAAPIFGNDDFPALGCGRGVLRVNPKQNLRSPGAAKPQN